MGNRELFKGCWIYDRIQWEKYTVLHLDFLDVDYQELGINKALTIALERISEEQGVELRGDSIHEKFIDLIRNLAKDKPIVILIDEYDKPITDQIHNPQKAEEHRDALNSRYVVLKSQQRYIHFLFMTGVSRFSPLSVFSDLNHLVDLSFNSDFVKLLGYTTEEIEFYFADYIQDYAATVPNYSREELFKNLKEYYNGYSWDGVTFVYNPVSIVNFFYEKEFKSFWFATGPPTFLAKMARERELDVKGWESFSVNEQFFDRFDITDIDTDLLLFQTGYLTVKKREGQRYFLSYPNREVENAFINNLLEEFAGQRPKVCENLSIDIQNSLEKNDITLFIDKMKAFLAAIPYPLVTGDVEKYYHLVFYLVLKMAMGKVNAEHFNNRGRMDMMVETDDYIYIFEFKMGSAQKALQQINDKGYYEQYLELGKKIILVVIGFNGEKRNIGDVAQSEISSGKEKKGLTTQETK